MQLAKKKHFTLIQLFFYIFSILDQDQPILNLVLVSDVKKVDPYLPNNPNNTNSFQGFNNVFFTVLPFFPINDLNLL